MPLRVTDTVGVETEGGEMPISHSVTINLTIIESPDFNITVDPGDITIEKGLSSSVTVGIVAEGAFTAPVQLSIAGLPAEVTATFADNPILPGQSTILTITIGSAAPLGDHPVTIIGEEQV